MVHDGEVRSTSLRCGEVLIEPRSYLGRPIDVVPPQRGGQEHDVPIAEFLRIGFAVADEATFGIDR